MKKITIDEWADAEGQYRESRGEPQPKNSLTVEQYAEKEKISHSHAQKRLMERYRAGLFGRRKWQDGISGGRIIYWPKPKKEWPK